MFVKQARPIVLVCVLLVVLLMAGCAGQAVETPEPDPDDSVSVDNPPPATEPPSGDLEPSELVIIDLAQVDSVELLIMESFPLQVAVLVRGNLPDGCTQIDGSNQQIDRNVIAINLYTEKSDADLACTEALVPYEVNISVDVLGLPAGDYTVLVNDVAVPYPLTFSADNVLPDEAVIPYPAGCPAGTLDGEPYYTAALAICFLYPQGYVVQDVGEGMLSISSSPPESSVRPVEAILTITRSPAGAETLATLNQSLKERYVDAEVTPQNTLVDGEAAFVYDNLPGRYANRQLFVLYQGWLYALVLESLDENASVLGMEAERMWEMVLESLRFVAEGDQGDILPTPVVYLTPTPTPHPISQPPEGDGGLQGFVTLGPICPVMREGDDSCADQPLAATISVLDLSGNLVTQAQSTDSGYYRIDLPPGTYILRPEKPEPGLFPFADEQQVTVVAGQYVEVPIMYDTGIR